jgi:hypothetical protein
MTEEKVKGVILDDENGRRTIEDGFQANRSKGAI